ncbi:MAG: Ig-like domain-containing protein [Nocardioidaceae bacterium]|nr:Ig-like domain-containing protein [Nocardioidaceae bacterium]MCL2613661.1 Ig-like domain-containing protein [Nocardioidaceae bacterium]
MPGKPGFDHLNRAWSLRAATALAVGLVLTLSACDATNNNADEASAQSGPSASSGAQKARHSQAPKPKKKVYPKGPPMYLDAIAPLSGSTVGVAMPISVLFTDPVKPGARKDIEQHIKLTTSTPVKGAWHWFGDQRMDFRPKGYWKPGTRISMVAAFKHVGDGYGRYGTHGYTRDFTIGSDTRTHVYVREHKTVVTHDGKVIRTMPSDAGSPQFPSWDGTMAVVDTERTTRMTSCSVGIACKKSDPNYYNLVLPWDVRITNSGTFLHYSTGDPYPGHSYGSHGCIHLSWDDAKWYYNLSKQGDPVTITGSPRGKAEGDNGYADYDVPWSEWIAGPGVGVFTTTKS